MEKLCPPFTCQQSHFHHRWIGWCWFQICVIVGLVPSELNHCKEFCPCLPWRVSSSTVMLTVSKCRTDQHLWGQGFSYNPQKSSWQRASALVVSWPSISLILLQCSIRVPLWRHQLGIIDKTASHSQAEVQQYHEKIWRKGKRIFSLMA